MIVVTIAYLFMGLVLFGTIYADSEIVTETWKQKTIALSVILIWPLWILIAVLVMMFYPVVKVFFNIDLSKKF